MGASSRYLKQFLVIVLEKGFPFSKRKIKIRWIKQEILNMQVVNIVNLITPYSDSGLVDFFAVKHLVLCPTNYCDF